MKPLILLACALACAMPNASAHTPYLLPNDFAPQPGATIGLEASFTETMLVPEFAYDHSVFEVTGPDGHTIAPDTVQAFKVRTVAEHTLPKTAGTWRFSTGPRIGARFRTWEFEGKQHSSREEDAKIPVGAKLLSDFRSLTQAEAYVSIGAPDRTALAGRGKGLELVPIEHPNDLFAGEQFSFVLQFDGKPLANQAVTISEAVWTSDRTPNEIALRTDAQGKATLANAQAGTWIALTRYRAPAPAGSGVPEYSHSHTLTFRVLSP